MNRAVRMLGSTVGRRSLTAIGMLGAVLLSSTASFAQYPPVVSIESFTGSGCTIVDTQPGFVTVRVRVWGSLSVDTWGLNFRVASGGGFTGVLVSEQYPSSFDAWGNVTDGVWVSYNTCFDMSSSIIEVVRLTYQLFGTSAPCATLEVLPHPGDGYLKAYDCGANAIEARTFGPLFVNYTPSCGSLWCVVATEETTWGKIKALYR